MKRLLLLLLIGSVMSGGSLPVQAHENWGDNRGQTNAWLSWGGLDADINHLNRMVGQVRWQLSRYHGNWSIRRDFDQVRREVDRVNGIHQRGDYHRRELRREIERLHGRLHDLETRLRVRQSDFYHWR